MTITQIVKRHIEVAAKAYVAAIIPVLASIVLAVTNVADIDFRTAGLTLLAASTQWAGVYYTANYKTKLEDLTGKSTERVSLRRQRRHGEEV